MINLIVNSKTNKHIDYIYRIIFELGLDKYEADLEIIFKKKCDNGMAGYCYGDNESVIIEIASQDDMSKFSTKQKMLHLAHEMVHAKQLITGELQSTRETKLAIGDQVFNISFTLWKGETFINTPYDDQPWEHEAYAMELSISNLYK